MFTGHEPTPGGLYRPPLSPNRPSSPQPHGEVSKIILTSPQHGPQTVIPCCWLSHTLTHTLGEHRVKQGLGVTAVRHPSQTRVVPTHEWSQEQKEKH